MFSICNLVLGPVTSFSLVYIDIGLRLFFFTTLNIIIDVLTIGSGATRVFFMRMLCNIAPLHAHENISSGATRKI